MLMFDVHVHVHVHVRLSFQLMERVWVSRYEMFRW